MMQKNGEAHTVTLSLEALTILERTKALRPADGDCRVFPGMAGKKLSDMTICKELAAPPYVVHGFRSTFRTWVAARMPSIPDAVAEAAVAHKNPRCWGAGLQSRQIHGAAADVARCLGTVCRCARRSRLVC